MMLFLGVVNLLVGIWSVDKSGHTWINTANFLVSGLYLVIWISEKEWT